MADEIMQAMRHQKAHEVREALSHDSYFNAAAAPASHSPPRTVGSGR